MKNLIIISLLLLVFGCKDSTTEEMIYKEFENKFPEGEILEIKSIHFEVTCDVCDLLYINKGDTISEKWQFCSDPLTERKFSQSFK